MRTFTFAKAAAATIYIGQQYAASSRIAGGTFGKVALWKNVALTQAQVAALAGAFNAG